MSREASSFGLITLRGLPGLPSATFSTFSRRSVRIIFTPVSFFKCRTSDGSTCLFRSSSKVFLMGLSWPLFLYFPLFHVIQLTDKFLPMLGFKMRISGVGSDRSANCVTTTAHLGLSLFEPVLAADLLV